MAKAVFKLEEVPADSLRGVVTNYVAGNIGPQEASEGLERILSKSYVLQNVWEGKTSFQELVEKITERYSSFRSRVLYPKPDEAADSHVRDVSEALNLVGESHVLPWAYETNGIMRNISSVRRVGALLGAYEGLLSALFYYPDKILVIAAFGGFGLGSIVGYFVSFPFASRRIKGMMQELTNVAAESDKSIREYKHQLEEVLK